MSNNTKILSATILGLSLFISSFQPVIAQGTTEIVVTSQTVIAEEAVSGIPTPESNVNAIATNGANLFDANFPSNPGNLVGLSGTTYMSTAYPAPEPGNDCTREVHAMRAEISVVNVSAGFTPIAAIIPSSDNRTIVAPALPDLLPSSISASTGIGFPSGSAQLNAIIPSIGHDSTFTLEADLDSDEDYSNVMAIISLARGQAAGGQEIEWSINNVEFDVTDTCTISNVIPSSVRSREANNGSRRRTNKRVRQQFAAAYEKAGKDVPTIYLVTPVKSSTFGIGGGCDPIFIEDLSYNSTDGVSGTEEVKLLQTHLQTLGYYTGSLDGLFRSRTSAAVGAFQSQNDIDVTGIFDSETRTVMNAVYCQA